VARNPPLTRSLQLTYRRLPVSMDRPLTTASNCFSYSSTWIGCLTKFPLVDSGDLFSSTAHLPILMTALKSRFTKSIRFLPSLVVLTNASRPSNFRPPFHLLFRQRFVLFHILRVRLALFHLGPLECAPQFMVCIRCLKLVYRYRGKTPCALLIRSCRWSWRSPFLGLPSPCSVRYYEPLTFILFEGTQLIEKFANARCFPPYRFIRKRAQLGFVYSFHSASQWATRTSMNLRKAS
jgi:hypothetical protein